VFGRTPYIHPGNVSEASDIIDEMLEAPSGTNPDRAFLLLSAAIEQNDDWLRDGELHLIGISNKPEQSDTVDGLYWIDQVESFQALRDSPAQVQMHAIGGGPPAGCTSDTGSALFFARFYEATILTDGVFLSICEQDWASDMRQLAEATVVDTSRFLLSNVPVVETLTVSVDGVEVPMSEGWSYDSERNAILFDEARTPAEGAIIDIDYAILTTCDG